MRHILLLLTLLSFSGLALAVPVLTIRADNKTWQCRRLERNGNSTIHRCTRVASDEVIYLTEHDQYGRDFRSYKLNGGRLEELPLQKVQSGRTTLRDTPDHIILNQRQSAYDRNSLLEQIKRSFAPSRSQELAGVRAEIIREEQTLAGLAQCPEINIKTTANPQENFSCQRARAQAGKTCDVFVCKQQNGESIIMSYSKIIEMRIPPQVWSLRNNRPTTFKSVSEARCGNEVLFQRQPPRLDLPDYDPDDFNFQNDYENLMTLNSGLDTSAVKQRFDFTNRYEMDTMVQNCDSPEIASHMQSEDAFIQAHLLTSARSRLKTVIRMVNGAQQMTIEAGRPATGQFCTLGNGILVEQTIANDQNLLSGLEAEFQLNSVNQTLDANVFQEAFNNVVALPNMGYQFTMDGCYARAHVIHDYMKRTYNIDCKKVWLHGYYLRPIQAPETNWLFHVAVSCPVRKADGSVEYQVLDPTTARGPVTQQEWIQGMRIPAAVNTGGRFVRDSSVFSYNVTGGEYYIPDDRGDGYEANLIKAREILEDYEEYRN